MIRTETGPRQHEEQTGEPTSDDLHTLEAEVGEPTTETVADDVLIVDAELVDDHDNVMPTAIPEVELTGTPKQIKAKKKLRKSLRSENRFKLYAEIMDDYGVDPLTGLVLPGGGDVMTGAVSMGYFVGEGLRSGISLIDYPKMVFFQGLDKIIGLVPGVGDMADLALRANTRNLKYFVKKSGKCEARALKEGVTQREINALKQEAEASVAPIRNFMQKYFGVVKDTHLKIRNVLHLGKPTHEKK